MNAPWIYAAASTDPTSNLLNYGALGALAVLLIAFAFRSYKREADRSDGLEIENRRLNAVIQEQEGRYQASLADAVTAIKDATRLITEVRAENAVRGRK